MGFQQEFLPKWSSILTGSELRGIICGAPTNSDWTEEELIKNMLTSNKLPKSSLIFKYFVEVLGGLDAEERGKFLRWWTGYIFLPAGRFKNLKYKLKLFLIRAQNRYPFAQTCFYQIVLPEYSSATELRKYLQAPIVEETFEIV